MEIEFNPGRFTAPGASQTVTRRAPPRPAAESEPFERTQTLERGLEKVPPVRSQQVERARTLIADVQYPPYEMLDSISHLLAMKITNQ